MFRKLHFIDMVEKISHNQVQVPNEGYYGADDLNFKSSPFHAVSATELNQKLCQLKIEQQENQIAELESELYLARSKLQEKEAELQALKNCVTLLTELPLPTVSGTSKCFVSLNLHLNSFHSFCITMLYQQKVHL